MKKFYCLVLSFSFFFLNTAQAYFAPVVEFYAAETWVQWNKHETAVPGPIPGEAPPDLFIDNHDQEEGFGWGTLLGVEWNPDPKRNPLYLQAGITYDYVTAVPVDGKVFFRSNPNNHDLNYSYDIQHQRIGLALKLLWGLDNWYPPVWFPYIEGGIGRAWNKTFHFEEEVLSGSLTTTRPMSGKTTKSTSYSVGAGIERLFGEHWRVGLGYLYTTAGKTNLENESAIPIDEDAFEKELHLQQVLLSVSYIGNF